MMDYISEKKELNVILYFKMFTHFCILLYCIALCVGGVYRWTKILL